MGTETVGLLIESKSGTIGNVGVSDLTVKPGETYKFTDKGMFEIFVPKSGGTNYNVSGRLVDEDMQPQPGIDAKFIFDDPTKERAIATTDADGKFTFSLPEGTNGIVTFNYESAEVKPEVVTNLNKDIDFGNMIKRSYGVVEVVVDENKGKIVGEDGDTFSSDLYSVVSATTLDFNGDKVVITDPPE